MKVYVGCTYVPWDSTTIECVKLSLTEAQEFLVDTLLENGVTAVWKEENPEISDEMISSNVYWSLEGEFAYVEEFDTDAKPYGS